jgi:hypothetical protein
MRNSGLTMRTLAESGSFCDSLAGRRLGLFGSLFLNVFNQAGKEGLVSDTEVLEPKRETHVRNVVNDLAPKLHPKDLWHIDFKRDQLSRGDLAAGQDETAAGTDIRNTSFAARQQSMPLRFDVGPNTL